MMLDTMTSPVMAQMMTVSQNVPVEETKAWRTGFFVCAAAATMGAEPIPDSLEKSPRAIPYRAATISTVPAVPPPTAFSENASWKISDIASLR